MNPHDEIIQSGSPSIHDGTLSTHPFASANKADGASSIVSIAINDRDNDQMNQHLYNESKAKDTTVGEIAQCQELQRWDSIFLEYFIFTWLTGCAFGMAMNTQYDKIIFGCGYLHFAAEASFASFCT